jgi:hypothetical protein
VANVVEILIKARDDSARTMGQASGRLDKFSDAARRARMSLLAVTGAVAALGVMSIKAGSELAEQMNRANVVFGESIDVVNEFAKTSAATFRLTKREAFEYSSVLGRIMQASGFTAAESAKMSVELLKVAGDLASVSNTPMPQVLAAIQSGLVGEVEPLRRFGVLLSQAALEAKAAELGLAKLGEELTEGQKVTARQAVIIEALSFAQGDAAKTAHSAAGEMAQFRVQNENLRAEIGRFLLPVTAELLGTINSLMQAFQDLDEPMQKIIIGAVALAAGLALVGLALPPVIAGFGVLAGMVAAVSWPIAAVGIAIGLLVTGAVLAMTRWKEGTKEALDWIRDAFFAVLFFVGEAVETAANVVIKGLNAMITAAQDAFNTITGFDVQFPTIEPWVNNQVADLKRLRDSMEEVASVELGRDPVGGLLAAKQRAAGPAFPLTIDEAVDDTNKRFGAGRIAVGEFASELDEAIGSGGMEDYLEAVKRTTEAADILGISHDEMVAGLAALEAGGASTQRAWELLGRSLSGQVSADFQVIINDFFDLGEAVDSAEQELFAFNDMTDKASENATALGISNETLHKIVATATEKLGSNVEAWKFIANLLQGQVDAALLETIRNMLGIGNAAEGAEKKVTSLIQALARVGGGGIHAQVEAARAVGAGPGGLGMMLAYMEETGEGLIAARNWLSDIQSRAVETGVIPPMLPGLALDRPTAKEMYDPDKPVVVSSAELALKREIHRGDIIINVSADVLALNDPEATARALGDEIDRILADRAVTAEQIGST